MWTEEEKQFYADLKWVKTKLRDSAYARAKTPKGAERRKKIYERCERISNLFYQQGFRNSNSVNWD